jgi:hypothetical protein
MKTGRSNQEASRLPSGRANRCAVYRGEGFRRQASCARQTLSRPLSCRHARRAGERDRRRRVTGQRIRSSSGGWSSPTRSRLRSSGRKPRTPSPSPGNNRERRGLRLFIAMRSRFAEESTAHAIEKGVRQILVLGGRLDTFACRLERTDDLRVFELDHPATQAEKRCRLSEAQTAAPAHVSYVAYDFEHGRMMGALGAAGFDPGGELLCCGSAPRPT